MGRSGLPVQPDDLVLMRRAYERVCRHWSRSVVAAARARLVGNGSWQSTGRHTAKRGDTVCTVTCMSDMQHPTAGMGGADSSGRAACCGWQGGGGTPRG